MRWLAALVLLLVAPAALADRPAWLDASLLVAAETSLAVDMLQTFQIKHRTFTTFDGRVYPIGWETNPLLGKHPTDAAVAGYFAGTMLLTGAAWYALPPRLRVLAPLLVLAIEIPQIGSNFAAGYSVRF